MANRHIAGGLLTDKSVLEKEMLSSKLADEALSPVEQVDVQDPKLWPVWKKVLLTAAVGLYGFTVSFGTAVYTPGIEAVAEQFKVSGVVATLGLSLYSEGLALGPMIGAPLSEAFGRKGAYLTTGPLLLLFIMGAGLAKNIETLLICRFLAGACGSPAIAISSGTVADLWDMRTSGGIASILIVSTFFLGPSMGPMIGGYTFESQHSWRWLMWASLLASGPALFVMLFTKETSIQHLRQQRAKKLGLPGPPKPAFKDSLKMLFVVTLYRPIKMLLREPIVTAWALYHSFIFGVLFGFFGSYHYVFINVYHFSLGEVGLAFVGILVGIVLSILVFALFLKLIYQKKAALLTSGKPPPEERLYVCMFGAFLLPISLFWFAWTARSDIHWIVPILAGVPFGCGMMCVFVGGVTYILDTYGHLYSASAMAANGLLRYTFGAMFPLFTTQMYVRLGIPWATSLLAFISVGLLPIPFVLYKFGPALRARSIFVGVTP